MAFLVKFLLCLRFITFNESIIDRGVNNWCIPLYRVFIAKILSPLQNLSLYRAPNYSVLEESPEDHEEADGQVDVQGLHVRDLGQCSEMKCSDNISFRGPAVLV